MKIKNKIIELFSSSNELSVKEIVDNLLVSKQAVHYVINQLLEENVVEKLGKTPKTIYRKIKKVNNSINVALPILTKSDEAFLLKNILVITETGKMLVGLEGFAHWCMQRKQPLEKTIKEYIETKKRYNQYFNESGLIDGTEKIINTKGYEKIWVDKLYYSDFYAIERFGKTRLGTLLHFAKQGQNKMLMKIMVEEIKETILNFIKKEKIDAVAFVPPTIRREVQIMKFIETHLKINLPLLKINKLSGIIPVPQKSLNKLEERIVNAENTFSLSSTAKYKNLLLIDDAVGSGATINGIAEKIKNKQIAKNIIGLAIVGSFKGFDVITDV